MSKPSRPDSGPAWLGATVKHEGFPLALRVRPRANTPGRRKRWPRLAVIIHTLDRVRPDGLPEAEYNGLLEDFDVAVVEALDALGEGLTVLVETFGGKRAYYAYVTDKVRAQEILAGITERFPQHKLELKGRQDPEWKFLAEYHDRFPWPE